MLEGFLGFEHRLIMSKVAKFWHSGEAVLPGISAGGLCVIYPGIRLTTREKGTDINLSQGSRRVPGGHDSVCRHGHLLTGSHDRFVAPGLPW